MKPCDIAILLGYPEISGGTNVIIEHALGLAGRGHRVSIVTEEPIDPQRLAWKPEALELPLLSHDDCRGRVFDLTMATWWWSAMHLPRVPARHYAYFVQSIESRFFSRTEAAMKALADFTYRLPLHVVTEAAWIADYLKTNYDRDAVVVRNGVDKQIFSPEGEAIEPRPADGLRVLVEGPLGVPFKRVEWTIRLCQQAGIEDIWLLTGSDCDRYPGVRRVLSKLPMTRVGEAYRSCDVLVKLSTVEGMFGPPLEMMHCGGTALVTDVTGHDEYIQHGVNSLVARQGEEFDVIRQLRRLQRDRGLLERLKSGALETARGWHDWPQAVAEMEQFVADVVEERQSESLVNTTAMQQLQTAYRLVGPLHEAVQIIRNGPPDPDIPPILTFLAKWVRRRLPWSKRPASPPPEPPPAPARPVPKLSQPTRLEHKSDYRVCFLGDPRRDRAHVPASASRLVTSFVDASIPLGAERIAAVRAFGPDVTFVFQPERLTPESLAELHGLVVGHVRHPVTPRRIEALRPMFPASDEAGAVLLHFDTDAAAELVGGGLACLGAFMLPTDRDAFGCEQSFQQWAQREIPVLFVGPSDPRHAPYLEALADMTDYLHVTGALSDHALRPVLRNTRIALHLPPADAVTDAANVVRDIMSGCLVAATDVAVDYGLMAGEHYVSFENPEELAAAVSQQLEHPDPQDVIRRNGQERARQFDAGQCYLRLIETHLSAPAPGTSEGP